MRSKRMPDRLKIDAIIEAICEVRFDMATTPEVLLGRLVDYRPWQDFVQRRMPAHDIPEPLRQAD